MTKVKRLLQTAHRRSNCEFDISVHAAVVAVGLDICFASEEEQILAMKAFLWKKNVFALLLADLARVEFNTTR